MFFSNFFHLNIFTHQLITTGKRDVPGVERPATPGQRPRQRALLSGEQPAVINWRFVQARTLASPALPQDRNSTAAELSAEIHATYRREPLRLAVIHYSFHYSQHPHPDYALLPCNLCTVCRFPGRVLTAFYPGKKKKSMKIMWSDDWHSYCSFHG